jgi:hypothetical protein
MKITLEENDHSNEPDRDDSLQSQSKETMETTLEENIPSNDLQHDHVLSATNVNSLFDTLVQVCRMEFLKQRPGKMMTVTEGTSRISSAILPEASQLIKKLTDKAAHHSNYYRSKKRKKQIPRLSSYVNRELSFKKEGYLPHQLSPLVFDLSVTMADEILSGGSFHTSLSNNMLTSLCLTEPESTSKNIRGFYSPRRYMRRLTKSVITFTLISWSLMSARHQEEGPVGDKVIHDILKYLDPFYQAIKDGRHNKEHQCSAWKSLRHLLGETGVHVLDMHNLHTATKKTGLVWHIISRFVKEKKEQSIPDYTNLKYIDRAIKQAVTKIIYFSNKEKEKMAAHTVTIPNHEVI